MCRRWSSYPEGLGEGWALGGVGLRLGSDVGRGRGRGRGGGGICKQMRTLPEYMLNVPVRNLILANLYLALDSMYIWMPLCSAVILSPHSLRGGE